MKTKNVIITKINENSKIIRYKELEKIINNDQALGAKMQELKAVQKQIVHAEKLQKNEQLSILKIQYDNMLENITNHPLMAEYIDLQEEVNHFLQEFKNIIESGIDSDLMEKWDKRPKNLILIGFLLENYY